MTGIPSTSEPTLLRELQDLQTVIGQVTQSLQQYKDMLKQRGMSIPPQVNSLLVALQADPNQLEGFIVTEQTELGQLRALAQMSASLTTSLDADVVLNEAMDIVIALTGAERGYLILIDEENNTIEYRIQRDATATPNTKPQVSKSILQHVIESREPLLTDNAFNDERLANQQSVASFSLRSVLCVPLMYKEQLIGLVYVDNRLHAGIFTERELNMLRAFANTVAVAIANATLYAELQGLLYEILQVQEVMNNIFDSIGSGVIATDESDTVTTFNRSAEEILALHVQDIVGHPLREVLPKVSHDLTLPLAQVRTEKRSVAIDAELTVGTARKAISLKFNPLRDSQDNMQGVAIVLDDHTEQRERDNQLKTIKTYLPPEMVDNIATISSLALGGESREVTCVFAEVRSLSTLHDVHPREIMDILNEYFGLATACINDTQGVVDKYMGTEIMALYNTQLNPQQNHAWLALEAALMMRDVFIGLYQRKGIQPNPHFYRIGIHTGIATLGNVGSLNRRDFTAIGDTINLAKRLEENAKSGQIILSDTCKQAIELASPNGVAVGYRFVELPPVQAKGRQQQTRVYEGFRA